MKKHNILKVVLLSILVVIVCTWIFPSASYQSELVVGERVQLGIFDLFSYVVELFRYFPYVILMTVATGIFYGVAYKIPAYRVVLDKIIKMFSGKESIFLAIAMVLIAAIVSVTGLSFGILFVFPFIISLVLLMGYNKLVAASVTVGSTIVGILGTTLGSNSTYYISAVLGIDVYGEMITKVILLVVGLVLLVFNVLLYAKKTKNVTDKVLELVPSNAEKKETKVVAKKENLEEKKKETKKVDSKKKDTKENEKTSKKSTKDSKSSTKTTSKTKKTTTTKTKAYDLKSKVETKVVVKPKKKVKTWPFILVFDLVVIILGIATFDWASVEINIFEEVLSAVQDFEIAGFPIFAKLLGGVSAFGQWTLNYEMPAFIILATCFLGFIYGLKLDEFFDGMIEGIKKAIAPAIYMLFAYLVLIIVTYNPFQLNITKFFMDITKDLNVITMTVIAMVSSILNIENIYVAQSTLPYVTSIITDSTLYPLLAIIFQAIYGLMMLVAPTSVILIGVLSYLDVSYGQWLKHIWKLFLELLVVLVVIFFIVFLI